MCFYSDDYCEVWNQNIVTGRKAYKCESCRRTIKAGEQQLSIWYVFEGEPGSYRVCNCCVQDGVAIHRAELRRGCPHHASWPPWGDVGGLIRRGNPDEWHEELDADRDNWDQQDPVLFWPYGVPPASRPVNLKLLSELA